MTFSSTVVARSKREPVHEVDLDWLISFSQNFFQAVFSLCAVEYKNDRGNAYVYT